MIYITGDTHGTIDLAKLYKRNFKKEGELGENDYVIICGDFGFIWDGDKRDDGRLRHWEQKRYTVLFVDGNHENFEALNKYHVEDWHGGKVHVIRKNVLHLMRGQVFNISGNKFFTFGGALSTDQIQRIEGRDWWKEEEASYKEIHDALSVLDKHNWEVDYVLTHAAPEKIVLNRISKIVNLYKLESSTERFLDEVYSNLKFKHWFCGHYHLDVDLLGTNVYVLYQKVIELSPGFPVMNPGYKKPNLYR
jgi:predicted phosphodiesterase